MASFGKSLSPLLRQLVSAQTHQLRSFSLCSRLLAPESAKPPSTPTPPKKPTPSSQTKPASADSAYKAKEYYSYNDMSFYDLEKEMAKCRVPQPSSKQRK